MRTPLIVFATLAVLTIGITIAIPAPVCLPRLQKSCKRAAADTEKRKTLVVVISFPYAPLFLNVEDILSDPSGMAFALAPHIGAAPIDLMRRLPHKKHARGKLAELVQRLTGRESTEVQIFHKLSWNGKHEQAQIDRRFEPIYAELLRRAVRPAGLST